MRLSIAGLIAVTVVGGLATGAQAACPPSQLTFDPKDLREMAREMVGCLDRWEDTGKHPQAAREALERGVAAAAGGQVEEAKAAFIEAVQIDPGHSGALMQLGVALIRSSQHSQALDFFLRAARAEPGRSEPVAALAWTLLALRHPELAEPYARRAVRLSPSSEVANCALGLSLAVQNRTSPEAAGYLRVAAVRLPVAERLQEWILETAAEVRE